MTNSLTQKNTYSTYWNRLGIALTISILLCLYLPRFLTVGSFIDGTTYAALARNIAANYGSWWAPRYGEADSFWLEGIRGDVFYEHPPLMFIVESFFFQLFGDHWWVEELFCGIIGAVFSILLIKIWNILFANSPIIQSSWIAILVVCSIPIVRFGISNNHLETLLIVIVQFSFYQLCRTLISHKPSGIYWAGLGIFLGFLTKGPFALFLLAAPFLYYFSASNFKETWPKALSQTIFLTTIVCLLIGGMLIYQPARSFFYHYFNQQVVQALQGARTDFSESSSSGLGRFYILLSLTRNLLPLAVVCSLCWGWVHWRLKQPLTLFENQKSLLRWLTLVGLSGILPIMLSPKQNTHYIAPSIPFLGLAFAAFLASLYDTWLKTRPLLPSKWFQQASLITIPIVGLVIVRIFLHFNLFTGTNIYLRTGIDELLSLQNLPKGSIVAVDNSKLITQDLGLNMSLQRFSRITLTTDTTRTPYRLSFIDKGAIYADGFTVIEQVPTFGIQFWQKKDIRRQ